jgi:hypothetical protein
MNCVAVYRETARGRNVDQVLPIETNETESPVSYSGRALSLAFGSWLVRNSAGSTACCRDKFHVVDLSFSRHIPELYHLLAYGSFLLSHYHWRIVVILAVYYLWLPLLCLEIARAKGMDETGGVCNLWWRSETCRKETTWKIGL